MQNLDKGYCMKIKMTAALTAFCLLATPAGQRVEAIERSTSLGGNGYVECARAPFLGPTIAFSAIALGAVIAFAFQQSHGGNSSHSHSGSSD